MTLSLFHNEKIKGHEKIIFVDQNVVWVEFIKKMGRIRV